MSIKLVYRGETSAPVEIEGLTPDWACGKSLAEIERFEIFHGNCKIPLAEMFAVFGDAADKRLDLPPQSMMAPFRMATDGTLKIDLTQRRKGRGGDRIYHDDTKDTTKARFDY